MRNDRCLAPGCELLGDVRCNYADRRGRVCTTSWCARHWETVDGKQYCRRHAGVVRALRGSPSEVAWPDVDNRAASLAGWIGAELDDTVSALFERLAIDAGARVLNDPVHLVQTPGGATRRWQRTWKLVDSTGVINKVAIEVDESNDADVIARVDADLIGHGVPPWIERRRLGSDGQTDAEARQAFIDAIARSIELVVTQQEVVSTY